MLENLAKIVDVPDLCPSCEENGVSNFCQNCGSFECSECSYDHHCGTCIPPEEHLTTVLNRLCAEELEHGKKMGWTRNTEGEGLMLIVAELAEAMEEVRVGRDVTELYFEGEKPCGVPSELADVIIRVASYCGFRGIDLGAAVEAKRAYNKTRPYRHGNKLL